MKIGGRYFSTLDSFLKLTYKKYFGIINIEKKKKERGEDYKVRRTE